MPRRLIAIGDVHGCAVQLAHLLDAIDPTPEDEVVFLGDYVDRGIDSRGVLEILLEVKRHVPRAVFLRGNHEEMMLGYFGLDGSRGSIFLRNGGAETLRSYDLLAAATGGEPVDSILRRFPQQHLDFLKEDLRLTHRSGNFAFVHAGVQPGVPLEEQERDDLLWIREPFLREDPRLSQTIVFGHTPRRGVLFDPPRKIGLDTGLVYGGTLSALELLGGTLYEIDAEDSEVRRRDVSRLLRP